MQNIWIIVSLSVVWFKLVYGHFLVITKVIRDLNWKTKKTKKTMKVLGDI